MPGKEDRSLDAIIRGTEDLIRGLPDPATIAKPTFLPDVDQRPPLPDVPQSLAALIEPSVDGTVDITVAADQMSVHATFFPPAGDGRPLDLDTVLETLQGKGVTTGIDGLTIRACLATCNEERTRVSDALIARGTRAVNEVPPYLVVNPQLLAREKPPAATDGSVDFREVSPFTMVKTGDLLGTMAPQQEGVMGATVGGTAIAFKKQVMPVAKAGKNTAWQGENLVATCDGRFVATIAHLWVEEVLDVKGDVDFHVGNIDFPGDVSIAGDIRDGFQVKAGKSVYCAHSVEASSVDCGGDFITRRGIIGKEKARLRVGGLLEARFMEGCMVDCGGPVRVQTSILNCRLHTRDRVETGERGIIIGGSITAQNGVSAAQIGTERGPRTEIHCGIDFTVEQKLIWIRDRNVALAFKLREVEAKMKVSPQTRGVLVPVREKIRAAIHKLNENARALVAMLDRNEEADVSVSQTVFPGTYIEICHVSYFVTKPRRFVTFRLDKPSGKIVELKWQKPRNPAPPAATPPA
jgi:uncharacterized protein